MFVDYIRLTLSAGKGGNGIIAWRREKYVPKGGPAGGNGGNGGSIFLEVDPQLSSLENFRNRRILRAENGNGGGPNRRKGKNGKDLILKIPPGTLIKNALTQETLWDSETSPSSWKICQGGKGGKGNAEFVSSTHQAPYHCTEGTPGEVKEIEFELKLLAHVGFIGMPNAGKSSLLNKITQRKVKIAPYPFTTLEPNVGLLFLEDGSKELLADIPGIISDAHKDRGLGLSFLRHIERTHLLVYVIDISAIEGRDPFQDFVTLQEELKAYDHSLLEKPFFVVLNKIDEEDAQEKLKVFQKRHPLSQERLFPLSALTGEGLAVFVKTLKQELSIKNQKNPISAIINPLKIEPFTASLQI